MRKRFVLPVPPNLLAAAFDIDVIVESKFRAIPRVAKLSCRYIERFEELRLVGSVSLVHSDGLTGKKSSLGAIGRDRVAQIAGCQREPAGNLIIQLGIDVEPNAIAFPVSCSRLSSIHWSAAKKRFMPQSQIAAEGEWPKAFHFVFQGILFCRDRIQGDASFGFCSVIFRFQFILPLGDAKPLVQF